MDAALNNCGHPLKATMGWLHAMWGIECMTGPYIMGYALNAGQGWSWGYRYISITDRLDGLLIFSLPLWKQRVPQPQNIETEPSADITEQSPPPKGLPGGHLRTTWHSRGMLTHPRRTARFSSCSSAIAHWNRPPCMGQQLHGARQGHRQDHGGRCGADLFCIGITVGRLRTVSSP